MHIVIITPYIPYPLTEGGKISQFALIDYIRAFHQITLICTTSTEEDKKNIEKLRTLWTNVTFEIIDTIGTSNQQKSVQQKIKHKIFNNLQYLKRVVLSKVTNNGSKIPEIERSYLLNLFQIKSRHFINELVTIINRQKEIDIIQIDIINYADLILALPTEIKKISIHHEIRHELLATTLNKQKDFYEQYALSLVKQQESAILNLYDAVFVFSENDKAKLEEYLPASRVKVSPFPVLDNNFVPSDMEKTDINKLVFVGGEAHYPNKDAVEWYIKEIGLEVLKTQNLVLHIIGNWSKASKEKYKHNKTIHFCGYVEDIKTYCADSVMLVPIRSGSGIRTKILYAMAQGLPVITTTIGCEGIVRDKESMMIANTKQEFIEKIGFLIEHPEFRQELIQAARTIAKNNYSQTVAGDLRIKLYKEIISN